MKLVKLRGVLTYKDRLVVVLDLPKKTEVYIFGVLVEVNELDIFTVHYN